MFRYLLPALLLGVVALPAAGQQDNAKIAVQARKVLKKYCYSCHHGEGSQRGAWDVVNRDSLVKDEAEEKAVLVPGKLDESRLWKRMGVRRNMPPRSEAEAPTESELEVVKKWIELGAPAYPVPTVRTTVTPEILLNHLIADLRKADPRDREYLRYFTLHEQSNNPAIDEEELRVLRAALSKVLNSLSWQPRLVIPKAVDEQQTIFVVDLRDLGWDRSRWEAVLARYPYGLDYRGNTAAGIRRLGTDMAGLCKDTLVYVRADWFVATASQAPLYYDLLKLPKTSDELEMRLKVDFIRNYRTDRLWRAGFAASGVSGQNRMVERHESSIGEYYWKSYDFKPRKARANLNRFPLGPTFADHPYPRQTFDHDGGEMIFGLPNGLQGYYLTDARGNRINEGPTDVVSDGLKTGGTPAIVNGGSCMHCHKVGMIPFTDTVREGHSLFGEPREKVERLYPEASKMVEMVKSDGDRFVRALEKATGPFLKVAEDRETAITDFVEPVGEVLRIYLLRDVDREKAAYELGIQKPDELAGMIKGNQKLKELGLLPLANGKLIKRGDWEAIEGTSTFQDVALLLGIGTPVRYR